jgi:hypothetical protein
MPVLHNIANSLTKYPKFKRILKDIYQEVGVLFSDKKSVPNTINCVSNTDYEHLFGYYDKSPWDASGTRMIYLRVNEANKFTASDNYADIILKNLITKKEEVIAQTHSWNVQQGCMLQWIGPKYLDDIIYNDFRDGQYCSVILNISSGNEKILPMPVYSVSNDGTIALTLDFSRLNSFRPGYGYINLKDETINDKYPDSPCIWRMNLNDGDIKPLFTYKSLFNIKPQEGMSDAFHKVNHIMINPSGNRFMFLHRWILNGVKYDRLITSNIEGEDLFILLDDDMVSHCNWKGDKTIIAWANTHEYGNHYYELKDKTKNLFILAKDELKVDGHPSYSPNGRYIITDTYPDFKKKQSLILYDIETQKIMKVAEVYSNIKYKNDTRCDLHPRWKRDSSEICFDGAQGEHRQVYTLKINDIINKNDSKNR